MYDLMMDRDSTNFGVSANREQACDKESERHKLYLIVLRKRVERKPSKDERHDPL